MSAGLHCILDLKKDFPRVIGPKSKDMPILIFTDGACEKITTIGGVIFVPGRGPLCFGAEVPEELCRHWTSKEAQEQIIGQAELFPLWVARLTWAELVQGKRVIYFVDNESARLAMVKAYSPILPSLEIVMGCLEWDYASGTSSWYARVPTASNIGDDPSRMSATFVIERYKALKTKPIFPGRVQPVRWL